MRETITSSVSTLKEGLYSCKNSGVLMTRCLGCFSTEKETWRARGGEGRTGFKSLNFVVSLRTALPKSMGVGFGGREKANDRGKVREGVSGTFTGAVAFLKNPGGVGV